MYARDFLNSKNISQWFFWDNFQASFGFQWTLIFLSYWGWGNIKILKYPTFADLSISVGFFLVFICFVCFCFFCLNNSNVIYARRNLLLVARCSLLLTFCSLLVTFYLLLNKKFWRIFFSKSKQKVLQINLYKKFNLWIAWKLG